MNKYHKVQKVSVKDDKLFLKVDGKECVFQLSNISDKLANAPDIVREKFEISPSGYGLFWPLLDEDLSIDGLLGRKHTSSKIKKSREKELLI